MKSPFAIFPPVLLAVCLLVPVVSCARANPEITGTNVKILRVQGPALTFAERLSVFVSFTDADGTSDFGSISIVNDDTGLEWSLPADECMTRMMENTLWSGSNNLAGPADGEIPPGRYTITVYDLEGNEARMAFDTKKTGFPPSAPLSFTINEGSWALHQNPSNAGFTRSWLFLYDDKMQQVFSWPVPSLTNGSLEGTVEQLQALNRTAVFVQCYTENADGSAGVLLTPVNLE
jgi:hypothetical protein